ncbi:hypothetical protein AbraIFM66951_009229 [Aspergillus brasiliensis]|uniref:Zn(2)-C6 fungal-type domain-containing protein n=1 Tax=Aspergillus brasiliensis TaxID=319629 RepID=A0A9W5YRT4_9EURO|nr:hypothetical protein AbraCBS73388_006538 [Aspergillus brasiliensis]GKZ46307.1 hypothetical protein AbraIFM66951_009229 [Aspergillus brasiliensis]
MAPPDQQPLKRVRVVRACEQCRARKVKCNGEDPCLTCWQHNQACKYGEAPLGRGRPSKKRKTVEPPTVTDGASTPTFILNSDLSGRELPRAKNPSLQDAARYSPEEYRQQLELRAGLGVANSQTGSFQFYGNENLNTRGVAQNQKASANRFPGPSSHFCFIQRIYQRMKCQPDGCLLDRPKTAVPWRDSAEFQALEATITHLNSSTTVRSQPPEPSSQSKYALSLWAQTIAVTKRHWISVWRDGMYKFSKMAKSIFFTMFVAFSFFHAGFTLQGLQNQMIALLILSWIIPSTCADLQDIWFRKWAIFTAREQNGIYDWRALLTALIVVEIPWQIFTYTLVYLSTYWTVGYPNETPIAGFYYFMWILLSIFGTGYSHLLAALFPSTTLGGYANSLFWVILMVVSGVLTPHAYLNDFYRPWLFWVDPMRYFFGASLGSVLHGVPVHCASSDLVTFDAPPGDTCGQYAAAFLESNPGYLVNPNATADCSYCPYSIGDEYLATLDYSYGQRWWNWAVFVGFCCTNFVLLFAIVWFTKGRGQRRT